MLVKNVLSITQRLLGTLCSRMPSCLCMIHFPATKPLSSPSPYDSRRSWLSWIQRRICHSVFLGLLGECLRGFSESGISLGLTVFQSKCCVINQFNFGLCTICHNPWGGQVLEEQCQCLWKTLRHLLLPIQDIRLNLTSQHLFLSDAFISSLE